MSVFESIRNAKRTRRNITGSQRVILKLISVCTVIAIFCSLTSSVSAYVLIGNYQMSGGAKNILFYVDSSAYEYKESISIGIQYWNYKSSNVSVWRTTTKSYSRCDCYWGDYFPYAPSVIASTSYLLNNQYINPTNSNWYWCQIRFNSEMYNYDNMTYFDRKGSSCHEYGHVLGLKDDNASIFRIMCQLGQGRQVNTPSSNDVDGIKAIYGG
jgi:hypothetical protein